MALLAVIPGGQLPSVLGVRSVGAQDTLRVASPLLLKRLGEALDGYRTGGLAYVVASYEYPNSVAGIFDTRREADIALSSLRGRFDVFGPYRTIRDRDLSPQMVICIHRMSLMTPDGYCGDGLRPAVAVSDVDSLFLTIHLKSGHVRREVIPIATDAVFLTLAAVDKFAMPYYAHAIGIEQTARMRQDFVQRMRSR
jgi:hypothetical protein